MLICTETMESARSKDASCVFIHASGENVAVRARRFEICHIWLTFHLITFSEMCTTTLSPPSSLPFPASGSQSKVVHMDNTNSSAMGMISGLHLSHTQTAAFVVGLFQEGHGHVHS